MGVWVGFAVLCVGAGSAWLYDLFVPGVLTGLPRTALHNGVVAAGCAVWALWRRERRVGVRVWVRLAVGGALVFAVPEIVLAGAAGHVTQATEVLVFLLVPVVVVFRVGQESSGFGVGGGAMVGLAPALVGLGGAALILPFESPSSVVGRVWFAGLVVSAVAAGVAAVPIHRLVSEVSLGWAGAVVFGVSCLLVGGFAWLWWAGVPAVSARGVGFEALRLVGVDGPILLLGLWLLREMRPVGFSARLLLVPAVTLVEGIVAERPEVGWYGWVGLVLMVGAGLVLLRTSEECKLSI